MERPGNPVQGGPALNRVHDTRPPANRRSVHHQDRDLGGCENGLGDAAEDELTGITVPAKCLTRVDDRTKKFKVCAQRLRGSESGHEDGFARFAAAGRH